MSLFVFVLGAMTLLAPLRDHSELASAVTRVVEDEEALFRRDEEKFRTAALMVAIAFRESSFTNAAKSKTDDHCAFQIHGRPDLARDVEACAREAYRMLHESIRVCRSSPVAWYAEGGNGCGSERARRISADRVAVSEWLLFKLKAKP